MVTHRPVCRTVLFDRICFESGAQTFRYLLSALGPIGLGVVYDLSGGWIWPLVVLLVVLGPSLVVGLGASCDRCVLPHAGRVAGADVGAPSR